VVGTIVPSIHFDFRNPVNLVITAERKFILVPTINRYDIRKVYHLGELSTNVVHQNVSVLSEFE